MTPCDPFADARAAYACSVSATVGVDDEAVIRALREVPRETSLGPRPWNVRTAALLPTARAAVGVQDVLHNVAVACANGHVQPAPDSLALLLHEAGIAPGSSVLLIGHHVAYAAALASHLAGSAVHVLELASDAVPAVDGRPADEAARIDVLLVLAGCSWLPWPWLQRLRPGARAVFPLLGVEGTALYWQLDRPRAGARWPARPLMLGQAEPWAEVWDPCAAALADALSHRLLDVKSVLPEASDGEDMMLVDDSGCFSKREGDVVTVTDRSLPTRLARGAAWGLDATLLQRLTAPATPGEVQDFVSAIPMNFVDGTCWSVRQVLQRNEAMCIEGAFVAAAALQLQGRPPLIVRLFSSDGIDHVVTLFMHAGRWGAISKGNHLWCRWRDPIYTSLRELMMSYMHEYVDDAGVEKTLVGHSDVYDLRRLPPSMWVTREDSCSEVDHRLGSWGFHALRAEAMLPARQRDALERQANALTQHRPPPP